MDVDKDIIENEKDDLGRKIIKTKYRLLNLMYKKYK